MAKRKFRKTGGAYSPFILEIIILKCTLYIYNKPVRGLGKTTMTHLHPRDF